MMSDSRLVVRVPASSANLGPGFDSLGLAVSLYLTVTAEPAAAWEVYSKTPSHAHFPKDDRHFIAMVAKEAANIYGMDMPSCRIQLESDIPLARGLGSSAAAIIAGIELADFYCGLQLDKKEKLAIAARMEGHPDNAGASLYGGLIVGSQKGNEVEVTSIPGFDLDVIAIIPGNELLTEEARDVLPKTMDFRHAVEASAAANQLIAALLTGNWKLAGRMMEQDLFHHPYRRHLVPWWEEAAGIARQAGALGTALSGAGPSVLCLAETGKGKAVAEALNESLSGIEAVMLKVDHDGCVSAVYSEDSANIRI